MRTILLAWEGKMRLEQKKNGKQGMVDCDDDKSVEAARNLFKTATGRTVVLG